MSVTSWINKLYTYIYVIQAHILVFYFLHANFKDIYTKADLSLSPFCGRKVFLEEINLCIG